MSDDAITRQTAIPGPHSLELKGPLREFESRNVTFLDETQPIFWHDALGCYVTDVDGNRYLDLTAAFGVANVGHGNAYVAASITDQSSRLMHGMGDVHPSDTKVKLLERLARIVPIGMTKIFLASTGAEAVEAAMKTAMLATEKGHFASFIGGYHGLSFGALGVGGIEKFRVPFTAFGFPPTLQLDFPRRVESSDGGLRAALTHTREQLGARTDFAGIIVEPIQGRGGCILPPPGYLAGLKRICEERGALLILDEIYTGFGRTGSWFACEQDDIVPHLLCIGKAMGGGFPISALVGPAEVMDAWPLSTGEALHTSTYLGNPMGCAAALAVLHEMQRMQLPARARYLGLLVATRLETLRKHPNVRDVRGRGLMWGIELPDAATAQRVVAAALQRGLILLQSGLDGNVLSLTPPLVIEERELATAIDILDEVLSG